MLEQPGRTQIRSENFTAKRPGIVGWQPTLSSRAANQNPSGILQRFPSGTAYIAVDGFLAGAADALARTRRVCRSVAFGSPTYLQSWAMDRHARAFDPRGRLRRSRLEAGWR